MEADPLDKVSVGVVAIGQFNQPRAVLTVGGVIICAIRMDLLDLEYGIGEENAGSEQCVNSDSDGKTD